MVLRSFSAACLVFVLTFVLAYSSQLRLMSCQMPMLVLVVCLSVSSVSFLWTSEKTANRTLFASSEMLLGSVLFIVQSLISLD